MIDITDKCFILDGYKSLYDKLIWKKKLNEEGVSVHVNRWDALIPRSLHTNIKKYKGDFFCDGTSLYVCFNDSSNMIKFKLTL